MERKEYSPEPYRPINPGVLAIIVLWQIEQIMRESEKQEFVNMMNA